MNPVVKICLVLFGIAYLISPIDIIPDLLLPYLGWLDDGAVIWAVYYIIRYGKLPWSKKNSPFAAESRESQSDKTPHNSGASQESSTKNTSNGSEEKKTSPSGAKTKLSISSACKILEVSPNASWKEIQAAYRDKSKKYHPDRVSHLGKEFSQLANEKFVEIQNAYELLKREKGR